MSNVGWFWFSQQLEQHLATHVFRAVENRMWYVTATNGGFSAIISPTGMIMEIGKRGAAEPVAGTISVNLNKPQQTTIYQMIGDWYALPFAIAVLVLSGIGYWERRKLKRELKQSKPKQRCNRKIA
jgi:apolipoprotein N-acyltransferase